MSKLTKFLGDYFFGTGARKACKKHEYFTREYEEGGERCGTSIRRYRADKAHEIINRNVIPNIKKTNATTP